MNKEIKMDVAEKVCSVIKDNNGHFKVYFDDLVDTLSPVYNDKTYTSSSTKEVRHIIYVNDEVLQWLKDEHNQFSVKNPEWYLVNRKVNISDKLFLILRLKWM